VRFRKNNKAVELSFQVCNHCGKRRGIKFRVWVIDYDVDAKYLPRVGLTDDPMSHAVTYHLCEACDAQQGGQPGFVVDSSMISEQIKLSALRELDIALQQPGVN
jgi:sulfur relay (sulfurtransferase) complex TusBCD TusD component (DsrE family)